ncbi:MAG: hypothetical protein OHK0039_12480 [Bacteroidia bacterium]
MSRYICIGYLLLGLHWTGCSEAVDVYAPPQTIWAVYGVLDPDKAIQTIRITGAFQVLGDAYMYADTSDGGIRGLEVSIVGENGMTYRAVQVDSMLRDTLGDFGPYLTAYQFETVGERRLRPGMRYDLRVRSGIDTTVFVQAYTRIPPRPEITFPNDISDPVGRCLRRVAFEDSTDIRFRSNPDMVPARALRYEIRVLLRYFADGRYREHFFGPTRLFDRDNGCSGGSDRTYCYQLASGVVLHALRTAMQDSRTSYTYDAEPRCGGLFDDLSDAVEIQVTAVDTFLARHILANDPYFLNLNQVRIEYTNLQGSVGVVGIFGSIAYDNLPVGLSPCSEYLLGFSRVRPSGCD